MDMKKIQELPTPEDLKKEFPLPYKVQKIKKQRDQEIELYESFGCITRKS